MGEWANGPVRCAIYTANQIIGELEFVRRHTRTAPLRLAERTPRNASGIPEADGTSPAPRFAQAPQQSVKR